MARIASVTELAADVVGNRDPAKGNPRFMQLCLDGAEAFAERYCKRTFAPLPAFDEDQVDSGDPVAKNFVALGRTIVPVPDLRVVESITLEDGLGPIPLTEGPLSAFGYWLNKYEMDCDAAQELQLMTTPVRRGQIVITGRWGWTTPPVDVKGAILVLAAKAYRRKDALWSDQMATADGLALFFTNNMPAEVSSVLDGYRMRRAGLL